METSDKIYLVSMIVLLALYCYFSYRLEKRYEKRDKELFRGMNITPPNFSEGKIDETD